jgi:hypothetical protein
VVCGIIHELRACRWTAIKITQYWHGVCAHEGESCECADPRHPVAISEENGATPDTDSGRFLAAGAIRALWVRTSAGSLGEAMPKLRRVLETTENTIIESNSLLQFVKPDLCLMVLDGGIEDFKPTSQRFLDRADALVATSDAPLVWPGVPGSLLEGKPRFLAASPGYFNDDLIRMVRLYSLRYCGSDAFAEHKESGD